MPPRRILVPIDGSPHSIATLRRALELAASWQASLVVLQVIEPILYPGLPVLPDGDLIKNLSEERFKAADEVLTGQGVSWERQVVEGMPADAICRTAQDGFDLIIIGSHGAGAVERFFFGSVADRVVHHAPCDVLVVR